MTGGRSLAHWAGIGFVLVVIAASAALVVTGGSTGGERTALPRDVDNVSERLASVGGIEGDLHRVVRRDNETVRTRMRYAVRPETGAVAYRKVGGNESGTDVVVTNGSVIWYYDRQSGNYSRQRIEMNQTNRMGRGIERLFASLEQTRATPRPRRTPTPGVAPVPAVPYPASGAGGNGTGVTYNGTDVVDGREAYVLHLSGQQLNSTGSVSTIDQTIWIDVEWYFPLKVRASGTVGGESVEVTTTLENVTMNPDLDDDRFTFDPPANATRRQETDRRRTYGSVAELRAQARLSVPRPDLPDGFTLSAATLVTRPDGGPQSIRLRYTNETSILTVLKIDESRQVPRTGGTRVSVDGRAGTYREYGISGAVSWQCGDATYSVSGDLVGRERLLAVATSVGCE